ncbi:MAG: M23 family metallopeptidase [Bacteroidia bacterium]|nr:M23 family metallopeptidase [Bacteroidia bacterium]
MKLNTIVLILLFIVKTHIVFAQINFPFPIDTIDITGNFGEIRNQHFHQGLDFSTKNKENYPVKCIDDGYIYRIKISPVGYGKVLYIHHLSGILSVYAHLNRFSDKIQSLVNLYLQKNQINEIDVILKSDSIKVSKNEIIAYSGNTGTSSGPHLHFEIRNELTEIPINPFFYFSIKDTTKPVIQKIVFYNLADTIAPQPVALKKLKTKDTILVPPILGIAFSGYDKTHPKGNPNNIYKVSVYFDNKKIYQHRLHYITFDNTIYVEYYADKINQQYFQKCFAPAIYPANFYDTLINKGRIILNDTNVHTLYLSFCDEKNNCTDTTLYIQTRQKPTFKKINTEKIFICHKSIHIKNQYFELHIPEKSFFQHLNAKIFYNIEKKQIQFTHSPLSLKNPATLKIYHNLSIEDAEKTILMSNRKFYTPDTIHRHQLVFTIKELNDFFLYTDKKAPHIQPISYHKKSRKIILPYTQQKIYFKLTDNTAIKDYKVYFNTQFCISYYYASKKILEVELPQERIAADENYIHIMAKDLVNNSTETIFPVVFQ